MINIGIVDDHQLFLDGLTAILRNEEHINIAFISNSGNDALIKLKEHSIDILITDISMPGMSGLELINAVKAKYPEIKIIVMSTFQNMESKNNIDAYLLKNTSKEDLISAIKNLYDTGKSSFYSSQINFEGYDFRKNILSSREKEIVIAISQGYTSSEISEKLFISKNTVEAHRKNIFFKLNVTNIAQLTTVAIKLGLVEY